VQSHIIIYTISKTITNQLSPLFKPKTMNNALISDYNLINNIHEMRENLELQGHSVPEVRTVKRDMDKLKQNSKKENKQH
jgi:hypothetical protein